MKKIVLAFIFLAISTAGYSQLIRGNQLNDAWKEYQKKSNGLAFDAGGVTYYEAYVASYLDSTGLWLALFDEFNRLDPKNYARIGKSNIPEHATLGQICSIVGKYLDNHPEIWASVGTYIIYSAIDEAFPYTIYSP